MGFAVTSSSFIVGEGQIQLCLAASYELPIASNDVGDKLTPLRIGAGVLVALTTIRLSISPSLQLTSKPDPFPPLATATASLRFSISGLNLPHFQPPMPLSCPSSIASIQSDFHFGTQDPISNRRTLIESL